MDSDCSELAILMTTNDPLEAEIVLSKLRSAGIACYIRHESVSSVIGLTFDGIGRQDVMVREEDLVEAQAALEREPRECVE
jgi:Putative prokaryotic signal transducing protein